MGRKKLTDDQLSLRTPQQIAETMKKRRAVERKLAAAAPPRPRLVVDFPKPQAPASGKRLDPHAQEIFDGIREQLESAGRWNPALEPILRSYSAVSAAIDAHGVANVPPGLLASQCRAAGVLGLPELPAARRAIRDSNTRRFGLDKPW